MQSPHPLRPLEHAAYLTLRADARVVEQDEHGDKVLLLPDGTYLKLFRRKRFVTSAAFKPYARRFADNAATLARLGIPCPRIIACYRIASITRDAVHYHPLAGRTIRQVIAAGLPPAEADLLRNRLLSFILHLHALGIYFRSAHLGNIVLTPEGDLGLIDISDLKVSWIRIGALRRRRNLRHILRYDQDRAWLLQSEAWRKLVEN